MSQNVLPEDEFLGKHMGTATSAEGDMFVTGHIYEIYERGVDHSQACPCVDYKLPA